MATNEFKAGWRVVAASLIGIAAGVSSLYFYSLGLFLKPLGAEFGWSRGEVSLGPLVGTSCAALMSIPMGGLVDRIGSRRVAIGSLLALAASFALLGFGIHGLPSYLALTATMSLLTAGSSPLPFTRLVVAAFTRTRGLAVGIALAGTGIGAILAPALLAPYIAAHGWRAGYYALSLAVLLACAPVALLLRDASADTVVPERAAIGTILRDQAFAAIGLPIFLASAAILGVVVHFVPMLSDGGVSVVTAGRTAASIGVAAIIGRLVVGVALDRLRAVTVATSLFAIAAIGIALLSVLGVEAGLPGALIIGLAVGAEGNLIAFLTARHFSRNRYGRAYGALYALFLIGGAIGPALIGFLFDATGGYRIPFAGAALALLLAALAALRLRGLRVCGE